MKNYWLKVLALLFLAGMLSGARADYPVRPIRIIVPFTPGGATDILARMIGQKLTQAWGQQVVIDNRSGANGVVAAELTAKANPDGHTLMFVACGRGPCQHDDLHHSHRGAPRQSGPVARACRHDLDA